MSVPPPVVVGALLLVAAGARAQDGPAAQPQPQVERRLATDPASAFARGPWNFTLSTFDGYDRASSDAATGRFTGTAADILQQSGQQGGFSARLNATKKHEASALSFTGGSTSEYYAAGSTLMTDVYASASESTKVGRRTTVTAAENFSYSPYYSLSLFPGLGTVPGTDLATPYEPTFDLGVSTSPVYRYGLAGQAVTPLTSHTDLIADYQGSRTLADGTVADTSYQEVGARVMHRTSASFGYHLGYAYAESASQGFHHLRIGVDGRKVLSRSRRTVFSFGTDSTLVRRPAGSLAPSTEFRLLGNADLDQYIGRTWAARLSYRRDVSMLDGFVAPVFREAVSFAVAGTLNRQTAAGLNGSYVLADLPGQLSDGRDRGLTGTAWGRVVLARNVSAFGQYTYYRHRFDAQASGLNLPPRFDRSSVRAGLLFTLPPGAGGAPQ